MKFITTNGESLARVATSGLHLTDDLKARVLSTFLTLMNLRENLDRASCAHRPARSGIFVRPVQAPTYFAYRDRAMAGSFVPLRMARPSLKMVIS